MRTEGEVGITTNVAEPVLREFTVPVRFTEHDTAIFAGFQQMWAETDDADGKGPLELTAGAGVGSTKGTIRFGGKTYVFDARQLVGAFLEEQGKEVEA